LFDEFRTGDWRAPLSRRMQAMFPAGGDGAPRPATQVAECDGEYRITAELRG